MRKYSLYKARKVNTPNPTKFACKIEDALEKKPWYIVLGALTYSELERCDLIYHGHNMTYDRCMVEIERLRKS